MLEFRNREDVERWLTGRPRADAVVLAARAALRVLPLLATGIARWALDETPGRGDYAAIIVLPVFRGTATPWVIARYPTQRIERTAVASYAAAAASSYAGGAPASHAAANSAVAASYADVTVAVAVANTALAAAYAAVSVDAEAIEGRMRARALADQPLWSAGVPDWAADAWQRLKDHLLARDEGWEVWTDWYEARLAGRRPWRKSIELARVTLDETFWKAGPKAVNGEIRRLIEEERTKTKPAKTEDASVADDAKTLVQRPSSHRFDWQGDRLEATPVTEQPFDPLLAEAIAEALREKAAELLAALTGNHVDDVVSRDVQRALDLLGAPVDRIAEGILLMRSNTVAAHARAYADAGSDRERSIRAALDDLSTSLGNLVDCYPGVRLINANRLELEVQEADAPAIAAQLDAIADLARDNAVVAPSAVEALDVGREELSDLDAKIATSGGAGRAVYITDRGAKVAARLLDATNFVSATAKWAGSEFAEVADMSWRNVKARIPGAVGDAAETATHIPILAFAAYLGVPWEAIAMMVPRLRPHARKVTEIIKAAQKTQERGVPDEESSR